MTVLHEVAEGIGAHERTLRRGLSDGLLRGRRPTARTVELAAGEIAYLRAHWPLLAALRDALRSERNVRLAVLIGSAARGALREGSDVDVLVELADAGWRAQDRLRERLARVARRPVDLVALEAAIDDPLLLDAALRDGRVLVDRDGRWPSLLARRPDVARAATGAGDELRAELNTLVSPVQRRLMGGGAPEAGDGAPRRGSPREQKVAARLREIVRDRRALRNALDRFDGGEDFARAWASEDPDQINRRDQVERPYQRIVDDIQAIIDFCEAEQAARGVPAPAGEDAGRWRRAALRGYLSHAQADRWQGIAQGRQRLAHHYADLPARHGVEIFERAHELLTDLPRAISGLGRWIDGLWPQSRD